MITAPMMIPRLKTTKRDAETSIAVKSAAKKGLFIEVGSNLVCNGGIAGLVEPIRE